MGTLAAFVYSDGGWGDTAASDQFLSVEIHDSDIATVRFAPVTALARGLLYLGYEPRHYFEDDTASAPVDGAAEADALIAWAAEVTGVLASADEILPLLADAHGDEPDEEFVENTAGRLLKAIGLLPPPDLEIDLEDD